MFASLLASGCPLTRCPYKHDDVRVLHSMFRTIFDIKSRFLRKYASLMTTLKVMLNIEIVIRSIYHINRITEFCGCCVCLFFSGSSSRRSSQRNEGCGGLFRGHLSVPGRDSCRSWWSHDNIAYNIACNASLPPISFLEFWLRWLLEQFCGNNSPGFYLVEFSSTLQQTPLLQTPNQVLIGLSRHRN